MTKRMVGLLVILAASGVALWYFMFRKSDIARAAVQPNPAVPPAPAAPASSGKKRTIFGKIVSGVVDAAKTIPGQSGQTLGQYAGVLSGFTK